MTAYGAGLRVSEVVSLQVGDIDSKRMLLRVRQGKGKKDRYAMLSPRLLEVLRAWWRSMHPVGLPAATSPTDWLFTGPRKGRHMNVTSLQAACRDAAPPPAWSNASPSTPCATIPGSGLFRVS